MGECKWNVVVAECQWHVVWCSHAGDRTVPKSMTDQQIRQAQLNAKAHQVEEGAMLLFGAVVLCRIHLVLCMLIFIPTLFAGKVPGTWKLGLPVTLVGLPGLINMKKTSKLADEGFALEHQSQQ